jgi:predicted transcriptional regulator YheO
MDLSIKIMSFSNNEITERNANDEETRQFLDEIENATWDEPVMVNRLEGNFHCQPKS